MGGNIYIVLEKKIYIWVFSRAGEPANFLAAPAPYFFSSGSGSDSGSWFFSQAAPAPCIFFKRLRLQWAKNTRLRPAPAPWQNILFPANW